MESDGHARSTGGVRELRQPPVRRSVGQRAAAARRPTSIVCWWRSGDAGGAAARRRAPAPACAGDDGPPRSSVRPTRHSPPHGDIDDDDVAAAAAGRAARFSYGAAGGVRQHPGSTTALRGLMASLALPSARPWRAMGMRDRPAGCASCASRLCGALWGSGRPPRDGRRRSFVGGDRAMLAAPRLGAARRRRRALATTGHRAAACDQHDTRRHTATSMMMMLLLRPPAAPRGSATGPPVVCDSTPVQQLR